MFEDRTPENIKAEIIAKLSPAIDTREGSFFHDLIGPVSVELYKMYRAFLEMELMIYVNETSGPYIDKRAEAYGITRKEGVAALGVLTFYGQEGTPVPKGTVAVSRSGAEYETLEETAIREGMAQVDAAARKPGRVFNREGGEALELLGGLPGIERVEAGPFLGGADPETDGELVQRIYAYWRKPSTSGNVYDYERWALRAEGVGAVKVFPLANGPGTVTVVIAGPKKLPVDAETVERCRAYIEEERPIGAAVTVKSAAELRVQVSARVALTGERTLGEVKEDFAAAVEEYLRNIAFVRHSLLYHRIVYLLMGLEGVADFAELAVNGQTENIALAEECVPVLEGVELVALV